MLDSKGEIVHQSLMAKKMQKLEDEHEFRPFRFRILAFTRAFMDELLRHGRSQQEVLPKTVRSYLWNQPVISRFNEEGKKSKSKGNHVWSVYAKSRQL